MSWRKTGRVVSVFPIFAAACPDIVRSRVRALGAEGQQVEFRATGFHARVIQHEHDHLIGKVFLDRMRSFESLTFLPEFSRYWQDNSNEAEEG